MRTVACAAAIAVALVGSTEGFQSSPLATVRTSQSAVNAYIPDGFTAESYKKFKENEAKKAAAKKNLGGMGPRGFKSRSMQSFQEAMERGEAQHLLPVFNAKERVRKGELKEEDIPYMQRGGSWDNSDVKGSKKKRWLKSDKDYASGGFKKEQSVSIFGKGDGLDWTGTKAKVGPPPGEMSIRRPVFAKNYKAPNVYSMKGVKAPPKKNNDDDKPKKKLFGLF